VGFVVDKAALGQVFSEYFGFPANHHSTNFSIIIITRGWHNRPVGGRSAQRTQLDSTPPYQLKKNILLLSPVDRRSRMRSVSQINME
jgi:hypothetical protein